VSIDVLTLNATIISLFWILRSRMGGLAGWDAFDRWLMRRLIKSYIVGFMVVSTDLAAQRGETRGR
jgi:hypothetical protein